jgi:hypothetical protein
LVNRPLVLGIAALALAACASVDKAVDDVREFTDHTPEAATYPDLANIPEKPARPSTAAEHQAAVQSLQSDRDQVEAGAEKLREDAAAMPAIPPPPPQRRGPRR